MIRRTKEGMAGMKNENNVDWFCGCGRTYLETNGFVTVVAGDNKCRDSDLVHKFQSEYWTDDMIKYVASKTPNVKHDWLRDIALIVAGMSFGMAIIRTIMHL